MKFSTALSFTLLLSALYQVAASPHNKEQQNNRSPGGKVAPPKAKNMGGNPNGANNKANKNGNNNAGSMNVTSGNNNAGSMNVTSGNNNAGNKNGGTGNEVAGNNNGGIGNNNADSDCADPQTCLVLNPAVIGTNTSQDGQDPPVEGQVPSLTSTNNFINLCFGKDITNGEQKKDGSCNPIPMGDIPSVDKMPSAKFVQPPNNGIVTSDTPFTIELAVKNLVTGQFVNAQKNYYGAPQQLQNGVILGHSHVVIQKLDSLDQTTPLDPTVFAFFKGLNNVADNGILSTEVEKGLPEGFYRACCINGASNHQPVLVPVAQRGSVDDCSYFTCAKNNGGNKAANNPKNGGANPSSSKAAPSPSAGGGRNNGGNNRNSAPSPSPSSPAPGSNGGGNSGNPRNGATNPSPTTSLSGPGGGGGGEKDDAYDS